MRVPRVCDAQGCGKGGGDQHRNEQCAHDDHDGRGSGGCSGQPEWQSGVCEQYRWVDGVGDRRGDLAGLPVVVALTVRTAQDRHRADLNSLLLEARPPIIRPRPLGESAVARLVRASLGAQDGGGTEATVRRPTGRGKSHVDPVDVVETHGPGHTSAVTSGSPLTEPEAFAIVT